MTTRDWTDPTIRLSPEEAADFSDRFDRAKFMVHALWQHADTHQGSPLFELTCRKPTDSLDVAQIVELGEAALREKFADSAMDADAIQAAAGANVLGSWPSCVTVGDTHAWVLLERIGGEHLPVLWVARPFRQIAPGADPVLPRARIVLDEAEVRTAVAVMLQGMAT